MKRRLLIIAIFLVLGAAANVAVAWTCVVFADLAMKEGGWDDRSPSMEKRWIGDHGWSAGKDSDICYEPSPTRPRKWRQTDRDCCGEGVKAWRREGTQRACCPESGETWEPNAVRCGD